MQVGGQGGEGILALVGVAEAEDRRGMDGDGRDRRERGVEQAAAVENAAGGADEGLALAGRRHRYPSPPSLRPRRSRLALAGA